MERLRFLLRGSILPALLLWLVPSAGQAQEIRDQEGSAAQAQETMASLFGPGTVMPIPPQVKGTIALPGFDSKELRVEEEGISGSEASGGSPQD